jgi:hypothetical protein
MTNLVEPRRSIFRFGLLAYLGAAISLGFCFWKSIFIVVGPILGLAFIEINPHLQAVLMWLFAAVTVIGLLIDRKYGGARCDHRDPLYLLSRQYSGVWLRIPADRGIPQSSSNVVFPQS